METYYENWSADPRCGLGAVVSMTLFVGRLNATISFMAFLIASNPAVTVAQNFAFLVLGKALLRIAIGGLQVATNQLTVLVDVIISGRLFDRIGLWGASGATLDAQWRFVKGFPDLWQVGAKHGKFWD